MIYLYYGQYTLLYNFGIHLLYTNKKRSTKMLKYDLHIHSCLSPCGSDDMTPANIAGMSFLAQLDVVAVTDHNSCLNIAAAAKACGRYGVKYLCGMEVCTNEDIHVLCYFKDIQKAMAFSDHIEQNTMKYDNAPEIYGNQLVMDSEDKVLGHVDHLLISGCNYSVYELVEVCHNMGGVCYYAHIDKQSYSVISVLGAIPQDIPADGVEIYDLSKRDWLIEMGYITAETPYISDSDAHQLELIGDKENYMDETHSLYGFIMQ